MVAERKMAKTKKLQLLQSTQTFSPVKDVRDGIIVTRDERYIKLLEFRPINFGLRSPAEQEEVIRKFADALRNFPSKFHFKIVSRRSDITPFVEQMRENMEKETVEAVRRQQEEQINLVTKIGTTMGVTRRFFLDFAYEAEDARMLAARTPTFEMVRSKLTRDEYRITADMNAIGNTLISRDTDEWVLSALYGIMCRAESDKTPFAKREAEVAARYAAAGINLQNELSLPINDFISPGRIDPAPSPKYMIIDGKYYMFGYIPSNAYPLRAHAGWLTPFLNFSEGVDIDIWFRKESIEKISNKLDLAIRMNHAKGSGADELDKDYASLMQAQESAYYIKRGLEAGDELGNFAVMFTIMADSYDELDIKYRELRKLCIRAGLVMKQCLFQSQQAFLSTLPICKYEDSIFEKSRRNMLLSEFSSIYPFTSFELSDEDGVMIGLNGNNSSLVFLDVFDTSKYNNANMMILGSPGGGKTYLSQLLALRMRAKGIQVFSLVAMKGFEYERACAAVEGQFVRVGPDSPHTINVMEIRKTYASKLDENSAASRSSKLVSKIQQITRFFELLLPDINVEEKQLLDEALINTYAEYGITQDNDSLIDENDPSQYKEMPILGDLYEQLILFAPKTDRLCSAVKRFVVGSARSFNQPTNIDLDNRYVIFDVSNMSKEMQPIGMFIATEFVWDKIREDPSKKKVLFMEECWRLGPIVNEIFKIIRGYGGSAVAVTQEITDTFSAENKEMSSTLVATSEIKVLMKTKPREAEIIGKELDLAEQEVQDRTEFRGKGQCLMLASANHVFVQVRGNRTEHDLITTDRRDYERILAQQNASMKRK